MAKLPYMQFYPGDWLLDTQPLSASARGIWIDMLSFMWREEPRTGTLEYTVAGWCKRLRCSDAEFRTAVKEMETENVCKIVKDESKDSVRVTSRRISRDEKLRKANRLYVSKYRSKLPCKDVVTAVKESCKRENQNHISEVRSQNQISESEEEKKKKKKESPLPPLQGGGVVVSDFDVFWLAYPKKVGKEAARKAWMKAKDKPGIESIVTAVRRQKNSEQWTKDHGQFIPHPATWLNQGRWADEVTEKPLSGLERFLARGTNGQTRVLQGLAAPDLTAVGTTVPGSGREPVED